MSDNELQNQIAKYREELMRFASNRDGTAQAAAHRESEREQSEDETADSEQNESSIARNEPTMTQMLESEPAMNARRAPASEQQTSADVRRMTSDRNTVSGGENMSHRHQSPNSGETMSQMRQTSGESENMSQMRQSSNDNENVPAAWRQPAMTEQQSASGQQTASGQQMSNTQQAATTQRQESQAGSARSAEQAGSIRGNTATAEERAEREQMSGRTTANEAVSAGMSPFDGSQVRASDAARAESERERDRLLEELRAAAIGDPDHPAYYEPAVTPSGTQNMGSGRTSAGMSDGTGTTSVGQSASTAANSGTSGFIGHLEVTARTGDGAMPVEGALVIVTSADENGRRLEYIAITDRNGSARIFDLPAADPRNSESPGMENPYYMYDVFISKDGYFDMESKGVPLFGGIKSRQDFRMIPLPEFNGTDENDIIENENTEPQNLR